MSKVFDHVSQRYLLGYKLLCLGFWDGKSFLPLDFSLHREKGRSKTKMFGLSRKQREEQYDKQREDGSYGSNRKAELDTPKTEQAIKMIRRAMKNGFRGDYVLADSWFFSYDLMKTIRRLKKGAVHLIAMAKMGRAKYSYDNIDYTAGQLRRHLRGKIKRCRKLGASYIACEAEYKGQPVKLFFVRYAGQKKWQMVVTTDTSLSFIKAMEIYSIRWSIEVFFKEAKQYLYLGKCQSNDFDAQIADTTITMTQYVLLAFCKRMNNYESMGEMFKDQRETISELLLSSRLWGLLVALARQLCEVLGIEPMNVMQQIMERSDDTRIIKILELCQNQNESEVGKKAA